MYRFRIEGKIKPYVRMTRRGKYVRPQAIEYMNSQIMLGMMLRQQMRDQGWEMLPGQTPLEVHIFISPANHRQDLDNIGKAILDAMSDIVFPDDRWVDKLWLSRDEPGEPEIEIRVWIIDEENVWVRAGNGHGKGHEPLPV